MRSNPIPLTPVESGLIAAIGHQDGTIAVQMKSTGVVYHYPANAQQFADFQGAESIGTHFARHIRPLGHIAKFEANDEQSTAGQ